MVIFYPDWRGLISLLALCTVTTVFAQDVPILLDAATTDFDRGNQRLVFKEISIKRGELGISADTADTSQLDFANSTWVFQGSVKIFGDNASVTAQRAEMEFIDHQLKRAKISGTPAVLSHSENASMRVRASEAIVMFNDNGLNSITLTGTLLNLNTLQQIPMPWSPGEAQVDSYNLDSEKITLADDAWVAQGENEIRGKEITYDIVAQRIVAGSDQIGDRVRITITPPPETVVPEINESTL